ncbi:MAG TPA: DUF4402 domain-containing protein [Flavobacterium sp.]|uniref:DUF4402 domain-containing protein n=1 Tax=Flavobacterium sp. TaxID=239 RepID=UPI002F3FBF47
MKNNLLTVASILTLGFFTNSAIAQSNTVTATTAGAEIASPIALSATGTLEFGSMYLTAAGTVTLNASTAARTITGGVVLMTSGATPSTPQFTVTGTADRTYAISLPTSITVTEPGTTTMTIDNLKTYVASVGDDTTTAGTLLTGSDTFKLGGILNVTGTQVAGVYAGVYNVTVDYN